MIEAVLTQRPAGHGTSHAPAAPDASPVVELTGVVRRFGTMRAVDGVDLAVRRGEFLTLLGPSGSGKTTLLRLVAGFERPDEGDVRIDGRSVAREPPHRRAVGMVFQNYALFPHKDVGGNVAFGLRMRRVDRREIARRVGEMLERVGLAGFQERAVHTLSGGQRQRVALARALVTQPAVLLLDEPLGALDLRLRRQMQHELKTLHLQSGTTFVLVTHDQEEALSLSDRIAVCRAGRIEQIGPAAAVYLDPATGFVASLVGEANVLRARRVPGGVELAGLGVHMAVAAPCDDAAVVLRPEQVAVGPAAAACTVRVPGTVQGAAFTGGDVVYHVRCGPAVLAARAPFRRGDAMLAPGTPVQLGWDPADCTTVPYTHEGAA